MSVRITPATLSSLVTLFLLALSHAAAAAPVTLDFNNLLNSQLATPYLEEGFTVSVLSAGNGGGAGICGGGGGEGALCGGTNTVPIRFRITGETPFNLVSLDVEQVFRNWRIEASNASILGLGSQTEVQSPGTISFELLPGWRGLAYFEIVHDPGEANGFINVDNIRLLSVPEPSTLALATVLAAIATNLRRQRLCPASTY